MDTQIFQTQNQLHGLEIKYFYCVLLVFTFFFLPLSEKLNVFFCVCILFGSSLSALSVFLRSCRNSHSHSLSALPCFLPLSPSLHQSQVKGYRASSRPCCRAALPKAVQIWLLLWDWWVLSWLSWGQTLGKSSTSIEPSSVPSMHQSSGNWCSPLEWGRPGAKLMLGTPCALKNSRYWALNTWLLCKYSEWEGDRETQWWDVTADKSLSINIYIRVYTYMLFFYQGSWFDIILFL